ncbi:6-phospho-3-hexuloisomerase [Terrilactibacillus sp. BCM23-1]|uniref:6-phospho-3-hexuloisomerase n=1 Tax=Terrilactibacillus tamarindi TaxID=2599694 RepID=A0A6N8CRV6_9BACI|nr:6-phospho-3-hexuloisomerase [Terrilactibacillus tamarindi]MTT32378.1 6-phospho-3-hexuloisomerase [Terrilactibacillus tamarindi]
MRVIDQIVNEIQGVIEKFDESSLDDVMSYLSKDRRIFVDGEGRSGFQARSFAMRLMHIGYQPYVMGETVTPSLKEKDVFVAISGSGKTKNTVSNAEAAKKLGLTVIGVTSKLDSPLAQLSDAVILVPGVTKGDKSGKSIQLLSSLFDQAVHIVLDDLCLRLSRRDHVSNEQAAANHINVE